MKKLKLNAQALRSAEMLSSEQLKSTLRAATGGYYVNCKCPDGGGSVMWCETTEECREICEIVCFG